MLALISLVGRADEGYTEAEVGETHLYIPLHHWLMGVDDSAFLPGHDYVEK